MNSSRTTEPVGSVDVYGVRGGVSFLAILTGVMVAFGTMLVIGALAGALALGTDAETGMNSVSAAIALIVIQFGAYLWAGYTAGRMGRGSGVAHGLLVPLTALAIALIGGWVATAYGPDVTNLDRFTLKYGGVDDSMALGFAILSGVAMFAGGLVGGIIGARWHDRLERDDLVFNDDDVDVDGPVLRQTGDSRAPAGDVRVIRHSHEHEITS